MLECESCHGKRFKSDILEVKFEGQNIYDVLNMTVNQAIEFFDAHGQSKISKKLKPLQDVGLGYIKLGQSSNTLSGAVSHVPPEKVDGKQLRSVSVVSKFVILASPRFKNSLTS